MIALATKAYSLWQLVVATNDFAAANLLGMGGCGLVFKGFIPGEGPIAVKKMGRADGGGIRQLMTEVKVLSRVRHKNVVHLRGHCLEEGQCLLVFDLYSQGSLHDKLHDSCEDLPWRARHRVALGTSKCLHYLHEQCDETIIHCDIKSANVLLTDDFDAQVRPLYLAITSADSASKVADFGMAKLYSDKETRPSCSTYLSGTVGYIAPECYTAGEFNVKTDVYSFGVLLLELISGKRAVASYNASKIPRNLLAWVSACQLT
eukprot:SM000009S23478  [mRNA]  locus=s9:220751:222376:+ [translate_table: standard]